MVADNRELYMQLLACPNRDCPTGTTPRQVAIKFWVAVIGGEVKIRYFPGKVPLLTDPLNLMMRFVLDIWTQKIDCLVHKKQIQIK